MTSVLRERKHNIKRAVSWTIVEYGTDDQWISVYPYGQKAIRGKTVECTVKIFNHSDVPKTFVVEPSPQWIQCYPAIAPVVIAPRAEGEQTFKIKVSKQAPAGVSLLLVNIKFDTGFT